MPRYIVIVQSVETKEFSVEARDPQHAEHVFMEAGGVFIGSSQGLEEISDVELATEKSD